MDAILYILTTFFRAFAANPGRFLPVLAVASAVTLVIALASDAMVRRQPVSVKSEDENRDSIPR